VKLIRRDGKRNKILYISQPKIVTEAVHFVYGVNLNLCTKIIIREVMREEKRREEKRREEKRREKRRVLTFS